MPNDAQRSLLILSSGDDSGAKDQNGVDCVQDIVKYYKKNHEYSPFFICVTLVL